MDTQQRPASLLTYLRRFGLMAPADYERLLAAWEPRELRADEVLTSIGQVVHDAFFVQQGVLRIVSPRLDGTEVTRFFLPRNRLCTLLDSFIQQVPAQESIRAACATQLLVISKTRLDDLYGKLPYLANLMQQAIQHELLQKIQQRNAGLGLDARTQYEQFLHQQPEVARQVSLTAIASYLGITPQSLSRLRKVRTTSDFTN